MTKHTIVSDFVESLERERMNAGLTQIQMAQQLEMSLSRYKKLVSGETSKVDLYTAYRLCTIADKWLFEICEDEVHPQLTQVASKLRNLTPLQLQFVSGIIDFEVNFVEHTHHEKVDDYVNLLTPTGSMQDGMIWDSMHLEKINVAYYRKRFGQDLHCAIRITSNHLHPVYNFGDIVLISRTAPRDGDIGLFINKEDNRGYVRKFHQTNFWILEPINNYGLPIIIDPCDSKEMDKWIVFGRILTKMRICDEAENSASS